MYIYIYRYGTELFARRYMLEDLVPEVYSYIHLHICISLSIYTSISVYVYLSIYIHIYLELSSFARRVPEIYSYI